MHQPPNLHWRKILWRAGSAALWIAFTVGSGARGGRTLTMSLSTDFKSDPTKKAFPAFPRGTAIQKLRKKAKKFAGFLLIRRPFLTLSKGRTLAPHRKLSNKKNSEKAVLIAMVGYH